MTFIMAGGGTGGHVIPALAVAHELRERGHEPVFFGTKNGYEARLVPASGFALETIEIGGLKRVGLAQTLRSLTLLPMAVWRVWSWIGERQPAAVFSMGGYVAGPVVIAALIRGLPLVVMEPNAVPGLTNRKVARWTAQALVNFEETLDWFPPGRAQVTGVPVRHEFFTVGSRPPANVPTLLVTGGSQGSQTLNNAGRDSWPAFARESASIRILHQAGRGNAAGLKDSFRESGLQGEVVEFISDMPSAFAQADLVVCRAGASTVAELAAAGRPAILVPFPFAADDHQRRNAEAMQRAGAARVVPDSEMSGERLCHEVQDLLGQPDVLRQMGENARKLGKREAAAKAADALEQFGAR